MSLLKKLADNTRTNSISNKFRRRRFAFFEKFISLLPRPVKILDVGGTENYWQQMGISVPLSTGRREHKSPFEGGRGMILSTGDDSFYEIEITILNTEDLDVQSRNIKFIKGDARDLSMFADKQFDVAFSNSVIEHVGNFTDQKKMADEIIRVAKKYFVQTPNYFFSFEPHFLFPCFQFLPRRVRIFLVTKFALGWYPRARSNNEAGELVDSINLLRKSDLRKLFPAANYFAEKFLFLTKSFIIHN